MFKAGSSANTETISQGSDSIPQVEERLRHDQLDLSPVQKEILSTLFLHYCIHEEPDQIAQPSANETGPVSRQQILHRSPSSTPNASRSHTEVDDEDPTHDINGSDALVSDTPDNIEHQPGPFAKGDVVNALLHLEAPDYPDDNPAQVIKILRGSRAKIAWLFSEEGGFLNGKVSFPDAVKRMYLLSGRTRVVPFEYMPKLAHPKRQICRIHHLVYDGRKRKFAMGEGLRPLLMN